MLSWVKKRIITKSHHKVIMLGLDRAGKTTILNYYKNLNFKQDIYPTRGAMIESVQFRDIELSVFDLGGQEAYRQLWENFYPSTSLIIFVVDSTARDRILDASEVFFKVIRHKNLDRAPILIFGNKQDLDDSMGEVELIKAFKLTELEDRSWHLVLTSAKNGNGLAHGFQWIYETLTAQKLSHTITLKEIFIYNSAGVLISHLGEKSSVNPESIIKTINNLQSIGKEVFLENFEYFQIGDNQVLFDELEELIGAIVVNSDDNREEAQKILHHILKAVMNEDPDKREEFLKELAEYWNINLKQ